MSASASYLKCSAAFSTTASKRRDGSSQTCFISSSQNMIVPTSPTLSLPLYHPLPVVSVCTDIGIKGLKKQNKTGMGKVKNRRCSAKCLRCSHRWCSNHSRECYSVKNAPQFQDCNMLGMWMLAFLLKAEKTKDFHSYCVSVSILRLLHFHVLHYEYCVLFVVSPGLCEITDHKCDHPCCAGWYNLWGNNWTPEQHM